MKLTLSAFAVSLLASTTSAWRLELYDTTRGLATSSGITNSGCINLSWSPVLNVFRVVFNGATNNWPDQTTFELYTERNCKFLTQRGYNGDYPMNPARPVRSYKVY
ncbi:hypothetical protein W97_07565 [Coniosporium apollinis CBS 100218]|uniref:Uncharacterized protein n=1 Tax=Coniosporium apollinis (strain CBS 100218) TaxID=1168221 RepID=R7Z2B0_CONA1|nr:uncharacterized protein W97_07565 [Coniosporium apollinis CBS 100218]EON68307.1 hypothetical protein W97_07565 [Coniosporium apollinis CBS 100218]